MRGKCWLLRLKKPSPGHCDDQRQDLNPSPAGSNAVTFKPPYKDLLLLLAQLSSMPKALGSHKPGVVVHRHGMLMFWRVEAGGSEVQNHSWHIVSRMLAWPT